MPRIHVTPQSYGVNAWFVCPACGIGHRYMVRNDGVQPSWAWNGDTSRPTFTPSLLMPDLGCHLFVKDGRIEFCGDCRHSLAGETVEMREIGDPRDFPGAWWEDGSE
jgi:hypothetical protein